MTAVDAAAEVTRLRAEVANSRAARPDLAKALLDLCQALDREDKPADAVMAAHEGILTLLPTRYADDARLTPLMDALVSEYLAIGRRSGHAPDRALLQEIAINRAAADREDEDDD